jgi:epoxyqueuosine reductase
MLYTRGLPHLNGGRSPDFDRFLRNVLIAICNDRSLAGEAERLIGDPSPLVRGAAIWALGRLDLQRLAALATAGRREHDPAVEDEWAAVLEDVSA